jgi:hypothetical protein
MYYSIDIGIIIDNKWINFNRISIVWKCEKHLGNFNNISRYRYIGSAKINTRHEAIEECLYLDLCTIYNIFSWICLIELSIHAIQRCLFHTRNVSYDIP